MPPTTRSATAPRPPSPPPPGPLTGCIIALSGKFPDGLTHHAIKRDLIEPLGGVVKPADVTWKTTHLVATAAEVEARAHRVGNAYMHNARIVTLQWLLDCSTGSRRVDEGPYRMWPPGSSEAYHEARRAAGIPTPPPPPPQTPADLLETQEEKDAFYKKLWEEQARRREGKAAKSAEVEKGRGGEEHEPQTRSAEASGDDG